MNTYSHEVSDLEFDNSPNPTKNELAVMSQALGMLLSVGVPTLECISVVMEITPNARLRKILNNAYYGIRHGDYIASSFSGYPRILGIKFISIVNDGEKMGCLVDALLEYAHYSGFKPGQLSRQIGWSECLTTFTKNMFESLKDDNSVLKSLSLSWKGTTAEFQETIKCVRNNVECGCTLSEAMDEAHFCDRFYYNMIQAGDRNHDLLTSFELLAKS